LDQFADAMANAYVAKSGMSRDDVLSLLKDGEDHYYTGEEAVAAGFADAVTTEETEEEEPDESARAFANQLLERISARGAPARYAGLAVTAALRGPHAPQPTPPAPAAERRGGAPAKPSATHPNPPASAEPTPPADAGNNPGDPSMLTPEQKAALAARRDSIRSQFAPFNSRTDIDQTALAQLQRECEDDVDMTPEAAGQKLLAFLGTAATPSGGPRAEIPRDETDSYREGAIQAVLHRANPRAHPLDDKSKAFRG